MPKTVLLVFGVLLALAIGALAADVSGKWVAQVPGRDGTPREVTFTFKVSGETLTGTVSGRQPGQDTPIADGKVAGNTISFTATSQRGDTAVKQTYTGTVSGSEIKFKREGGQGPAREFTAKRAG
jgi:hypothetical protein